MPVSISHVYNANDRHLNFCGLGYGWRTNYNQLVYYWSVDSSYMIWEDEDGTKHYFKYESDGVYKDETDNGLTLTNTGSGATKFCIQDLSLIHIFLAQKSIFTASAVSKWLNAPNQENGITAVSYTHLDVYKRQQYRCL